MQGQLYAYQNVLVEVMTPEEEKTEGGVIVSKERYNKGVVVDVGKLPDGTQEIRVGDVVMFTRGYALTAKIAAVDAPAIIAVARAEVDGDE